MGNCWMQNLILHLTSSPDQNLSKITWRYVKNTNKKVFFMIPIPKFILKNCLNLYDISNLNQFHWIIHVDMEFESGLKGPF